MLKLTLNHHFNEPISIDCIEQPN